MKTDHLNGITNVIHSAEYHAVSEFYGSRIAQRSKVPLIHHINEGLMVLSIIGATEDAQKAFCLHPLLQNDDDLLQAGEEFMINHKFSQCAIVLAMEYRWVANNYLQHCKMPEGGIKLSALGGVNQMLVADKVQNRKDFEIYHKGTHANSDRLDQYFKEWLQALGISEEQYQELASQITFQS